MSIDINADRVCNASVGAEGNRPSPLRPGGTENATRLLRDHALRTVPVFELNEEVEELRRWFARYTLRLEEEAFADEEERRRLIGGREYIVARMQEIAAEIDVRVRARKYGYPERQGEPDPSLSDRFARLREQGGAQELADLISLETRQPGFKTRGRWRFLCPFHNEDSPSLVVFEDAFAHCFGCGWHGDIAKFVADRGSISNSQALILLERGLA